MPKPRPPLPPVIRATLPVRSNRLPLLLVMAIRSVGEFEFSLSVWWDAEFENDLPEHLCLLNIRR